MSSTTNGLPVIGYICGVMDHELRVFWGFTWRDWSATIIPGFMHTLASLRALDPPPSNELIATTVLRSLVYFTICVYSFDLANQINGIAEDRIDKPDRPLPSGRVSLRGAYIRWYATTAAHVAVSVKWGVLQWTLLGVLITIYTNFFGGNKHWITKNLLFIPIGTLCLLQAAWRLGGPIEARQWQWALTLSGVLGFVTNIQDLRDVEGDRIAGRQTLPLVLGPSFRWVMAGIICTTPIVCWELEFLRHSHWLVDYCGALLTLSMFYLAYRVFRGDSKSYDHQTYMLLTYIYCGCIAVPMIFP
ncbi:UbiA prenyltransferase family-domain-containing protein [Mycena crocata]|nr:UbiA prenyltransferase family-domain-containing protein [Mycena crocata]